MPVKIYSKTEQEKFNAFIERLYQGLNIQGKNKEELQVLETEEVGEESTDE